MGAARKLTHEFIVDKIDELPTLPTIVYELTRIINDPMSSTKEVEKVMSNDQSLTTKVLKMVNSAYYAIPGGVSSLSRAIAYIGFDTVNQLVLSSSIIDALNVEATESIFVINDFWKHSIGVAVSSEIISKYTHQGMPSDAFTSGLIHDMGKIATFVISQETVNEVTLFAKENKCSYLDAEKELEIPNHTLIGKLLCEKWQLPQQMAAIAKNHHQKDPNLRGGLSSELNSLVDTVYLANLLTHALKFGNSGHNIIQGAPKEVLERLQIDPKTDLNKLLKEIKFGLEKSEDLVRTICG